MSFVHILIAAVIGSILIGKIVELFARARFWWRIR